VATAKKSRETLARADSKCLQSPLSRDEENIAYLRFSGVFRGQLLTNRSGFRAVADRWDEAYCQQTSSARTTETGSTTTADLRNCLEIEGTGRSRSRCVGNWRGCCVAQFPGPFPDAERLQVADQHGRD